MRCTAAVSCHVLFVCGALRDVTIGGSQLPPSPKGVTPAVAHTTLFLVLPARSCGECPAHFGPTPLSLFGLASSGRVTPFLCVTRLLSLQMVTRPPNRWSKALLPNGSSTTTLFQQSQMHLEATSAARRTAQMSRLLLITLQMKSIITATPSKSDEKMQQIMYLQLPSIQEGSLVRTALSHVLHFAVASSE